MTDFKFPLGKKVKDKITGFNGTLTGVARYLTGCDQYAVQPEVTGADFKTPHWFDEGRLEIIGEGIKQDEVLAEKNGCDFSAPLK